MPNQPPAAVAAAIKRDETAVPEDKLDKLRAAVREVRDLRRDEQDLTERLAQVKAQINEREGKTLPDLFTEAKVDHIGLEAEGNLPAYDAEMKPYYHANISAEWPMEQQQKGFDWLDENKFGDLIKSMYVVMVPRGARAKALEVEEALEKLGVEYEVKLGVPWNTLTAWLKERVEKFKSTPPLDLLGATVGKVVKLKERKTNG